MSTPIHPPLCLRPGALDVPVPDVDPSRWDGAAMERATFLALPRVPGYKYELLDGTARIRPVDSPVVLLEALDQIAERLWKTERERPVAVQPILWAQDDALLDRHLVA